MNQLATFAVRYPRIIIAATFAITILLAAATALKGMGFDGSPQTLTRQGGDLQFYNETKSVFGDDRVIIVALTTDDVFSRVFLDRLRRLTTRLIGIPGVAEVLSLTNVKAVRSDGQGIIVDKLVSPTASDDDLARLKQTVTSDPLYLHHYVSADGRTVAINVFLDPIGGPESRVVAQQIEAAAKEHLNGDELLLAGVPVMDERAVDGVVRDMSVLSGVAGLLCLLVFLGAFRSFWGAVLPMAALFIGLVWTVGVMSLAQRPFTFATLGIPTTLLAVGSSYAFHVLNQYRLSVGQLRAGTTREQAWLEGLRFIGPAVVVSGTTTMAGFGALASSPVPTARDMGLFEALGVGFMLVLSLFFVPAVLALLPGRAIARRGAGHSGYWPLLDRLLRNVTALILFRRRGIVTVALLLTLVVAAGAVRLEVNTDYLGVFPPSSETVQAARKLHERLAGAASVQVVVARSEQSVGLHDFLSGVASVQRYAMEQQGVDSAISVADVVKSLDGLLPGRRESAADGIPIDPTRLASIVDDYLLQDDSVARLVDRDFSRAAVVLRTNLFSSNELRGLTTSIEEWSRQTLPSGMEARTTGTFVLLNDAADAVARSQASSLAIALIAVYLMMSALFRSFATGLLALIPNLLPIALYFGFLGWAAIPLDIGTSLVASAALGLAVDNAVHMIRRYRQCTHEQGGSSPERDGWAVWLTMLRTGQPMVAANAMLIGVFLVFLLSSFVAVQTAGLLWTITILACLTSDLVFLPALMRTRPFVKVALGKQVPRQVEQ
jgi:hypothetical protein